MVLTKSADSGAPLEYDSESVGFRGTRTQASIYILIVKEIVESG